MMTHCTSCGARGCCLCLSQDVPSGVLHEQQVFNGERINAGTEIASNSILRASHKRLACHIERTIQEQGCGSMIPESLQKAPEQWVFFAFYYVQPNAIAGQTEFSWNRLSVI